MRKKVILLRDDYPYAESLRLMDRWIIDIVPSCCYLGRADAVVLDSPSAMELADEIERAGMTGENPRIIAVSDQYACMAISAFCPHAAAVRSDDAVMGLSQVLSGKKPQSISFSHRELVLLSMMRNGPSNKELSLSMSVSERTVRRIKEGIFRKTGLVSGEQLAVFSLYIDQYSQLLTYLG